LNGDKRNKEYSKEDEKSNDSTVRPVVRRASPLKRKKQANYSTHKQYIPNRIELHNLFHEPTLYLGQFLINVQKDHDTYHSDRTYGDCVCL